MFRRARAREARTKLRQELQVCLRNRRRVGGLFSETRLRSECVKQIRRHFLQRAEHLLHAHVKALAHTQTHTHTRADPSALQAKRTRGSAPFACWAAFATFPNAAAEPAAFVQTNGG